MADDTRGITQARAETAAKLAQMINTSPHLVMSAAARGGTTGGWRITRDDEDGWIATPSSRKRRKTPKRPSPAQLTSTLLVVSSEAEIDALASHYSVNRKTLLAWAEDEGLVKGIRFTRKPSNA